MRGSIIIPLVVASSATAQYFNDYDISSRDLEELYARDLESLGTGDLYARDFEDIEARDLDDVYARDVEGLHPRDIEDLYIRSSEDAGTRNAHARNLKDLLTRSSEDAGTRKANARDHEGLYARSSEDAGTRNVHTSDLRGLYVRSSEDAGTRSIHARDLDDLTARELEDLYVRSSEDAGTQKLHARDFGIIAARAAEAEADPLLGELISGASKLGQGLAKGIGSAGGKTLNAVGKVGGQFGFGTHAGGKPVTQQQHDRRDKAKTFFSTFFKSLKKRDLVDLEARHAEAQAEEQLYAHLRARQILARHANPEADEELMKRDPEAEADALAALLTEEQREMADEALVSASCVFATPLTQ